MAVNVIASVCVRVCVCVCCMSVHVVLYPLLGREHSC